MERSDGVDISPHCQRCGSTNTKFCYYNNYSLTQPRYFCKGCRRYWTKGGSLRNVPVGGGCRKSRRGRAISISRYHHHNHKSPSPLSYTGLDVGCGTSNSSSHIDLAVVYANYLKQGSKHEPEPVKNLPKDDSSTLEIGAHVNAMPFDLPPLLNGEGLMFSQAGDWFDSRLVGSNEVSLTRIPPDKFTNEIHDISHLINNWSSFDFSI